jgi:hypothetical protein
MGAGWIVGIALVVSGAFGTYWEIRNTRGPRERAFMTKVAAVCWAYVLCYLLLLIVLPRPYSLFAAIPYAIFLCLGIVYANRTAERIRQEESANQPTDAPRP